MTNEKTDLEQTGRLFHCICRNHKKNADLMLERSGLHHSQARLLMILARENGITHTEIADELRISTAAASKVIKRMEQDGYVLREADDSDERVSRVFLQSKGKTLVDKIHATFQQLDNVMFDGLTNEEINELYALLCRVQKNLQGNLSKLE